jgi:hypothetical protein
MTFTTADNALRELDRRANDGIEVRLMWNAVANEVMVAVHDSRTEESFELPVAGADALDAVHHPYAYATAPASPGRRRATTRGEMA